MSAPSVHVTWALNKVPGKEHVYFANFVRRFDLYDEESATRDFMAVLDSPNIRTRRREKLKKAFRDFQDHHRKPFWAERILQVNTEVTVKHAGVVIQDAGVKQAKIACEKFFSDAGGSSTDQDLLDDSEDENEAEPVEAQMTPLYVPLSRNDGDQHPVTVASNRSSSTLLVSKA
ncbi:hypothetical protein EDD11_009604 [Mortierella claussenii]|nr:hypothetical protein EDD11_009604 [Mortierella claussenii]